ncbi:MAG: undecaprenyl-diphosphatase UppP [Fidelibacterota bacterium]
MNLIDSIILGFLQGLTEFLPISSSGHLVLGKSMLHIYTPGAVLEILLHFGTLLAILIYYFKDLMFLAKGVFVKDRRKSSIDYILAVVVSTLPAVIIGLSFNDFIEASFSNVTFVGVNLIFTGIILYLTRYRQNGQIQKIPLKAALIIGFAQALAILPGVSRSGMTISAALFLGINSKEAAKFSFIMAIPVLFGAGLLHFNDTISLNGSQNQMNFIIGFLVSAVTGLICILTLLKMLSKQKLWIFSIYCWSIGTISLLINLLN